MASDSPRLSSLAAAVGGMSLRQLVRNHKQRGVVRMISEC